MRKKLIPALCFLLTCAFALCLCVPQRLDGQPPGGFNFFDQTRYSLATPTSTGIILWRGTATQTATFGSLFGAGLDITGNPVRVVGAGKNTILASLAATADKTMTFPNVTGNVVSTGDTGTVTNTMLTGSIAASKLIGTDIATVGTITAGTWTGTTIAIANGGTGNTTAANAINALLPTQTSNSGKFLTTNGSAASWDTALNGNIGSSGTTMTGVGVANVQTSAAGLGNGADTTDDTLFTYSLPSNAMSANGKSIRVISSGHFAANGNNKRVKLWFAGTAIADSGVLTSSNIDWKCSMEVTRIDSTHVSCVGIFAANSVAPLVAVTANLAVSDLTANASVIKITGASTTTGAANDVTGYLQKTWFEN